MFVAKVGIAVACGWGAYVLIDNVNEFKPGQPNQITSSWIVILVRLLNCSRNCSRVVSHGF